MMDSADPLHGWPVMEVFQKAPGAKNDVYGSLFLYIQELLLQFCQRIRGLKKICFQLCQINALKLPDILRKGGIDKHYFDRIEVWRSNELSWIMRTQASLERLLIAFRSQT
jgi:hypothetical protein